jgi:hypothetical protein
VHFSTGLIKGSREKDFGTGNYHRASTNDLLFLPNWKVAQVNGTSLAKQSKRPILPAPIIPAPIGVIQTGSIPA